MMKYYYNQNNEIKEIETIQTIDRLRELQPKYRSMELYTDKADVPAPEGYKRDGDGFVKTKAKIKEEEQAEAKARLAEIDKETIRPLRAKLAGVATTKDEEKLKELEEEAKELRGNL